MPLSGPPSYTENNFYSEAVRACSALVERSYVRYTALNPRPKIPVITPQDWEKLIAQGVKVELLPAKGPRKPGNSLENRMKVAAAVEELKSLTVRRIGDIKHLAIKHDISEQSLVRYNRAA